MSRSEVSFIQKLLSGHTHTQSPVLYCVPLPCSVICIQTHTYMHEKFLQITIALGLGFCMLFSVACLLVKNTHTKTPDQSARHRWMAAVSRSGRLVGGRRQVESLPRRQFAQATFKGYKTRSSNSRTQLIYTMKRVLNVSCQHSFF